ncbi:'Cold-shock' DNA-binding domain-containing protein [Rhizobium miluonense]|uniref:'Cold-shock' DNA-binding domain-containing protein n=1 Tax=Rhizobium miluonense TaxID=411945 RepID=A0A1C3W8P9_9HYPH|nr:'Cold-shock' DNA-binding domain-containing protein [Rhizobium miluonense]
MNIGTVRWFNSTKAFGFIQPDNGSDDLLSIFRPLSAPVCAAS